MRFQAVSDPLGALMKGMPVTVTSSCLHFWIPTQKSILNACHCEGTHELVACEYQVAFELYRKIPFYYAHHKILVLFLP